MERIPFPRIEVVNLQDLAIGGILAIARATQHLRWQPRPASSDHFRVSEPTVDPIPNQMIFPYDSEGTPIEV